MLYLLPPSYATFISLVDLFVIIIFHRLNISSISHTELSILAMSLNILSARNDKSVWEIDIICVEVSATSQRSYLFLVFMFYGIKILGLI